nr:immunoglobulin heavy chain junction region [Macaca mulatta]MOX62062.1 immunoglobulin heavy chain junction region [Macaca mulatta]MOX62225.1 immunoglobulin heavy chain junction region [Macaca mulatta]MOX63226.1 immunoglobulin heavy chain junction region [Macaca mulatta]MOX65814.1 immunoglobulin heavy chain junction region [Macaca mulatta]
CTTLYGGSYYVDYFDSW